jgi:hypothetical protein
MLQLLLAPLAIGVANAARLAVLASTEAALGRLQQP